ncbi:Predicted DNA-binding transcriptional regulator YafY, contains an HTH and WYL domains [Azospirillum oryzae]|uniref:Predicted DNA-binding transcriptional regulator YafY, contains an HTH and WYL domains n=1 Tax=Azospirillum oryzae TaxID=286727 RepID=A0A1X7HE45_9PROT|nr:YafY family protein [Azospirillum oryzae]SMF84840.1 Predicted DNA-binding transcriptional regulator YafY, contains an HTH and WYL domains [Azospirillum oryzae]
MSRAERLLDLMQVLRRHRQPVSGRSLAGELGVSLRTLYRDIATLQAQGAMIEGEPGVGYLLRAGFLLPPLMFTEEEVEALVLGSRWVVDRGDSRLGGAARNALAKIAAVLPPDKREGLDGSTLLVGPGEPIAAGDAELATIRSAIRTERKLEIAYRDRDGSESRRTVWPFALGFFDRVRVMVAWCELRQSFRHFRTDRILALTASETRYPRRRQAMLKEWRAAEGIPQR